LEKLVFDIRGVGILPKKAIDEIKVFMSAKSDIIFKIFFGDEHNKDILIEFLIAVLKLPLEEF